MYGWAIGAHSVFRWAVLILGVMVVIRVLAGRLGGRAWTSTDDRVGRLWVVSLDVQFLVGLVLLLFGPVTSMGLHEPAMMMGSRLLRFFTLEHPLLMLIALGLAHIGYARARRAALPDRHRKAAPYYTLALILILAAIPWPFLSYGRPLVPTAW